MIAAREAVCTARSLMGTLYKEMDCIALIRAVIRQSAGGKADYRCEGTNWLWRSIGNSGKYRHLTWRQTHMDGACAGMLAFKRNGEDIHHVGLVTGDGTVIHASSAAGCVVETKLDSSWDCLGTHRYIAAEQAQSDGMDEAQAQRAAD
ncbi:MAG: C40 family peptidase [Clostridia bacterium]|nr:C40 family peptidase [Clostridia bacterium]